MRTRASLSPADVDYVLFWTLLYRMVSVVIVMVTIPMRPALPAWMAEAFQLPLYNKQRTADTFCSGPPAIPAPCASDMYLLKTNSSGTTEWSKTYGEASWGDEGDPSSRLRMADTFFWGKRRAPARMLPVFIVEICILSKQILPETFHGVRNLALQIWSRLTQYARPVTADTFYAEGHDPVLLWTAFIL